MRTEVRETTQTRKFAVSTFGLARTSKVTARRGTSTTTTKQRNNNNYYDYGTQTTPRDTFSIQGATRLPTSRTIGTGNGHCRCGLCLSIRGKCGADGNGTYPITTRCGDPRAPHVEGGTTKKATTTTEKTLSLLLFCSNDGNVQTAWILDGWPATV